MESKLEARTCPPRGGIGRHQDSGSGSWFWRAYVAWNGRRVDRCFQDSTYGDKGHSGAMADAWRKAMVAAFLEAAARPADAAFLKERIAAVNARFDALRPHMVCLSVYVMALDGEPCQLRALVSDRGQKLQRKELAANYRSVPMQVALASLRERVRLQIVEFFGADVAAGFMARHGRRFRISQFDENGGLEIRERADQFLPMASNTV